MIYPSAIWNMHIIKGESYKNEVENFCGDTIWPDSFIFLLGFWVINQSLDFIFLVGNHSIGFASYLMQLDFSLS